MRLLQGVFLLSLIALIAFGACRRNSPSLVDTNAGPDTELWYAPPDSTEYQYKVHLYWRGLDTDGTVENFIWVIKDTLDTNENTVWNPKDRLADFRTGRFTSRTDTVISFTAFRNVGGVGLKKNRQAFHIAAVDDNGIIDGTPAAMEFVATIDELPRVRFRTEIDGTQRNYAHSVPPKDTAGMYKPFKIAYEGTTRNGEITAYRFFPLSAEFEVPGQNVWSTDLGDTVREFPNTQGTAAEIGSGVFRFAVQCRDQANAESNVDAGRFREGVAQVVVNFDPDTRITRLENSYTINDVVNKEDVDFADGQPDTVPYQSWLTIFYSGWDDRRDEKLCDPLNEDKCIDFQFQYFRTTSRPYGPPVSSQETSQWLPSSTLKTEYRQVGHDTDPFSATDSNTVNLGSQEYQFRVRAIDENEKPDGTPSRVNVVGNYSPTLDSIALFDHLGNQYSLAGDDTVTWNFWNPAEGADTTTFDSNFCVFVSKSWYFNIRAWGHDHPKDPDESGVKAWYYYVYNDAGVPVKIGRSFGWYNEIDGMGDVIPNMTDERVSFGCEYSLGGNPAVCDPPDPGGATCYDNLPAWLNGNLEIRLLGRDTAILEEDFDQYVYLNGSRELINSFPSPTFGRYTELKSFAFHLRMER